MSNLRLGPVTYNAQSGDLLRDGVKVRIRPKTAAFLSFLLKQPGKIVSKDELFDEIWNDRIVGDNTLMQCVRELRHALDDSASEPRYIETVHGRGYRWIGPTPTLSDEARNLSPNTVRKKFAYSIAATALLAFISLGYFWIEKFSFEGNPAPTIAVLPVLNNTNVDAFEAVTGRLTTHLVDELLLLKVFQAVELNTDQRPASSVWLLETTLTEAQGVTQFAYRLEGPTGTVAGVSKTLTELAVAIADVATGDAPLGNSIDGGGFDFSRGLSAYRRGNSDLAKRYLEASLLVDPENKETMVVLAAAHYELGSWPEAEMLIAAIGEEVPGLGQRIYGFAAEISGRIAHRKGDVHNAERALTNAKSHYEADGDIVAQAGILNSLALVYTDKGHTGDYLAARSAASNLLAVQSELPSHAAALLSIATTVNPIITEQSNRERLEQAAILFEQLGDQRNFAAAKRAFGANPAFSMGERKAALLESLRVYRSIGNRIGVIDTQFELSSQYIREMSGQEALNAVEEVRIAAKNLGARRDEARATFYRGLAHMTIALDTETTAKRREIEFAIEDFDAAIEIYDSLGIVFDSAAPRLHLGAALLETNRNRDALAAFEQAERKFRALHYRPGQAGALIGAARAKMMLGSTEEAIDLLNKAERLLPQISPISNRLRARMAYENGETNLAIQLMEGAREASGETWTRIDENALTSFRNDAAQAGMELPPFSMFALFISSDRGAT